MVEITCEVCRKPFQVKPYRAMKARFCSQKCGGRWHMSVRTMPNEHKLGNKWRQGRRPANAFPVGHTPANKAEGASHVCAQCGVEFRIKPWIERQNQTKSGFRFCGKPCHAAYKREREAGPNAPDYVGGITTYRGKGWLEARKAAVARDKGTCQRCHEHVGDSIPVHHKTPFRRFTTAAAANVLSNLVCLCQSCHMIVERQTQ